jgi:hypothetical protein
MPDYSRALARSGPAEKHAAAKPLHRTCNCAAVGQTCARCHSVVQRRSLDGSQAPLSDIPDSVRQTVRRPGRSLDAGVREDMEQHFGTSFGHVRVHTDPDAARSAGDVRAAAYAFGNNLVFNQGYYRPDSRFGRQVLAHELTHVLQQARGAGSAQAIGPAHEQEADRAAQALDDPRASFGVRQASAVGVGPLTFGELQKKAWGYVPDVAKPYVAPLALEVKAQAEKIVSPDAQVPPAMVTALEDPVAAAKKATGNLAAEAKVKARDFSMQQAGRLKGVVMEGTSIVDTLVWTAHMSAQAHGLVDPKSKAPEISGTVAKAIDDVAQAGEKRVFGNLPPEQSLVFSSYEMGELEGAIGSQVALGFVGVEEVQLALKALGVLGSVRGLMLMLEKHGVGGWYKNPEFIGALVGVGLSFLSLKSTKASHKIVRIVVNTALASGNLISAGPAVWKLYNDWKQIPESDPKRNETLKADLGALVKLVANIVVDILRHQSSRKGGVNEPAPAHPEAEPPPSTKTAPAEPAVAPPTDVAKPAAAPVKEAPVAAMPTKPGASPTPVETPAPVVRPEAPVDVGLSNRGVRPEPGTRAMGKTEWKAQESAARRAKRIDEAIARVEADAKLASANSAEPVAKLGTPATTGGGAGMVAANELPAALKPKVAEGTGDGSSGARAQVPEVDPRFKGLLENSTPANDNKLPAVTEPMPESATTAQGGKLIEMGDRPRDAAPYKFKEGSPVVQPIGKPKTKSPPSEPNSMPNEAVAAVSDASVQSRRLADVEAAPQLLAAGDRPMASIRSNSKPPGKLAPVPLASTTSAKPASTVGRFRRRGAPPAGSSGLSARPKEGGPVYVNGEVLNASEAGLQIKSSPGGKAVKPLTELGQFVHKFKMELPAIMKSSPPEIFTTGSEHLFNLDGTPRADLRHEYPIPHTSGRPDAVDVGPAKKAVELGPPRQAALKFVEAQQYAEWLNKMSPLPDGKVWTPAAVIYHQQRILAFAESIGYLPRSATPAELAERVALLNKSGVATPSGKPWTVENIKGHLAEVDEFLADKGLR